MIHPALAANPLQTRADLVAAAWALLHPLAPLYSPGRARVRFGTTGAFYPQAASEMQGFCRPLWALAALAAGGEPLGPWRDRVLAGLDHGTDPDHPEFWGRPGDHDQRFCEAAAIGFALRQAPATFFDPLPRAARQRLVTWLAAINDHELHDNNWLLFRVMVNLGLRAVGAPWRPDLCAQALGRIATFELRDGWIGDGPAGICDAYGPSALHFYGLLYAHWAGDVDPARAAAIRARAAAFAPQLDAWFAPDGAAIPYGRSLSYRFVQGAFYAAAALAGVEGLPPGNCRGHLLRHLRWWFRQPFCSETGLLTVGYAYPNLHVGEVYIDPSSVYWALKALLPVALPDDHPFWTEPAEAPPPALPVTTQPGPRVVITDHGGHRVALAAGRVPAYAGGNYPARYAKFAYSSALGFNLSTSAGGLEHAAHDSMLALSDDGGEVFRVRQRCTDATVADGVVRATWEPMRGVTVTTWLAPAGAWHVRVHVVESDRPLRAAEGGFALGAAGDLANVLAGPGAARLGSECGLSGVLDLLPDPLPREGTIVQAAPNANLLNQRTFIPTLWATLPAGRHVLTTAVLGLPARLTDTADWTAPPTAARPGDRLDIRDPRGDIVLTIQLPAGPLAGS